MQKTPTKQFSTGFTLVELLVVIGILGILIVALIAALDPLEQIRKGNDSGRKTAAGQLRDALSRFYATQGGMPWAVTVGGASTGSCNGALAVNNPGPATPIINNLFTTCLSTGTDSNLVDTGELKNIWLSQPSLKEADGTSALFISWDLVSGASTAIICYDPESKSESSKAESKYTASGGDPVPGTCPDPANDCYQCIFQ